MIYPRRTTPTPDARTGSAGSLETAESPEEMWFDVAGRTVHGWRATPTGHARIGGVVIVPGLGLPQYTFPTALAVAAQGLTCTVLDLPGFGSDRADVTRSHIHAIGRAAAAWVLAQPRSEVTVLLGHSTGAQAALTAALALQEVRGDLAVVLAGPTFVPRQRRFLPLAAATLTAYRRDSLRELVVAPSLARGRLGVVDVLRSGMRDDTEARIRRLVLPVALTAGEADSYAPRWWLDRLAAAAGRAPQVRVDVLPGSHNNLFTEADRMAAVLVRAATDPGLPTRPPGTSPAAPELLADLDEGTASTHEGTDVARQA